MIRTPKAHASPMVPDLQIYDITVTLGGGAIDYPGDPPFRREQVSAIRTGGAYDLSRLEMSAHAGTHIDAPAHFIPGGRTIDQYAAADFIFPAHVVTIESRESIRASELAALAIRPGDAVLFKTENSRSGRCRSGAFSPDYVTLSVEAAELLVRKKAGLAGVDYLSADRHDAPDHPVHQALLRNGILILEGIDLGQVPEGRYTLWCLPLKIAGAEASPVRAVLVPRPPARENCQK
jgi:arylformamidase